MKEVKINRRLRKQISQFELLTTEPQIDGIEYRALIRGESKTGNIPHTLFKSWAADSGLWDQEEFPNYLEFLFYIDLDAACQDMLTEAILATMATKN